MGILRLLLAISVLLAHSSSVFGVNLVGGQAAVQAFYIVSGFYMALILKEKYIGNYNSYKLFITNRLLRLFPVYWAVIILVLIVGFLSYFLTDGHKIIGLEAYSNNINNFDFISIVFLVFTNIFMVFQDWVMFMGIDITNSEFFFTTNFKETSPQLYKFLLVPQAWTIGLEITFYLIAPFLLRLKVKYIILLMLISAAIRVVLYYFGYSNDPWSYRFFPSELFFFLLGILAYYIYKIIPLPTVRQKYLLFYLIIFLTFIYSFFQFPGKIYLYLFIFFLVLPSVFSLSKKWKKDRSIGELSYPLYISHYFLLNIMIYFKIESNKGLILLISTLLLSILLNQLISKRVEIYRQSRVDKKV